MIPSSTPPLATAADQNQTKDAWSLSFKNCLPCISSGGKGLANFFVLLSGKEKLFYYSFAIKRGRIV